MALKGEILERLTKADGDISGQTLARELGVSRNAVWKAIESLRRDGCEIASVTNRGYRLTGGDALTAEAVSARLGDDSLRVVMYKSVDSTNSEAKRLAAQGVTDELLIVAEEQTCGRGRHGRSFYSPAATGLYMSIALHPLKRLDAAVQVTTMAGAAVAQAIEANGRDAQIKWVNDVYVDGRKVCGILTEAVTDFESRTVDTLIIGIGVNLWTTDFPNELAGIAGSVGAGTRAALAADITSRFMRMYRSLPDNSYIDYCRSHSMVLGRQIRYFTGETEHSATAVDIDGAGGLIIKRDDGGTDVLTSGEITLRLR